MRAEDRLQTHCAKYLKAALPPPGWFSGIEHARKQSVFAGQIQKAKGVKRGLADLNVWYRGQFIGIELKVESSVSEAQERFGRAMLENGFAWVVVRSVLQLHDVLVMHGIPVAPSMQIAALHHDAALSVPAVASKSKGRPRKAPVNRAALKAVARLAAAGVRL